MLQSKRFWFSLFISVGFLVFFLYRTDFGQIEASFRQADYLLAFAAVPLYFVGFWIRTVRWHYLLRPVRNVSVPRLYPVVLIGLMANNVLPARVGELVRAYLVGQRESITKSGALGSIAADRAFDGLTLVAILGAVTAFSGADAQIKSIGIGTALVFIAASGVLAALALAPARPRALILKLTRFLPKHLEDVADTLLDNFIDGLRGLRSPSVLLIATVCSVASWLIETAMYYVVGEAFHLNVGFEVYLLIAAAANLALSVFATPGGVGPFEVTTQAVLIDLFGVTQTTASAYAIALHALLLAPVILVGFGLLWGAQLSLHELMGGAPRPLKPKPSVISATPQVE